MRLFLNEIERRESRGRSVRVTIPRSTILKLFDTMLLGNTGPPSWHGVSTASSCKHVHVHCTRRRSTQARKRSAARSTCRMFANCVQRGKGGTTPWREPVTDRQSSQYLYIVGSGMILFSTVQLRFKAARNGRKHFKGLTISRLCLLGQYRSINIGIVMNRRSLFCVIYDLTLWRKIQLRLNCEFLYKFTFL